MDNKPIDLNIITTKSRRVWHCPPHFTKVDIEPTDNNNKLTFHSFDNHDQLMSDIRNWVYEHIEHRFYIGIATTIKNGVLFNRSVVAFENPTDATYFTLIKPQLFSE